MTRLVWDKIGERLYETGIEQGVLYPKVSGAYPEGVAWNGLIGVTENPSGAEPNPLYADNIKYLNLVSAEEFAASIEAYMYPKEFSLCDGSALPSAAPGVKLMQQPRTGFGLAYKTKIGNDALGDDYGYKIHLVYDALASPTDKSYATVNDTPEAITFSWDITTTPVPVTGFKPTAHLIIDSTKVNSAKLKLLENQLFGVDEDLEASPAVEPITPNLPLPDAIIALLS